MPDKDSFQDGISPGISELVGLSSPSFDAFYRLAVGKGSAAETGPRVSAKMPRIVEASVAGWVMGICRHAWTSAPRSFRRLLMQEDPERSGDNGQDDQPQPILVMLMAAAAFSQRSHGRAEICQRLQR